MRHGVTLLYTISYIQYILYVLYYKLQNVTSNRASKPQTSKLHCSLGHLQILNWIPSASLKTVLTKSHDTPTRTLVNLDVALWGVRGFRGFGRL